MLDKAPPLPMHLSTSRLVADLIHKKALPHDFATTVDAFYWPLAQNINKKIAPKKQSNQTYFVGVQGSQGSGKSTCADFLKLLLESEYEYRVLVTSIDDFYLTKSERLVMSEVVHPLFKTRGVPGTHDVSLIKSVFDSADCKALFKAPTFNKAIDDRNPINDWQDIKEPVDVVIFEGWCVGIPPQKDQELIEPLNALEREEDNNQIWRTTVNNSLRDDYQALFKRLDILVSLQVPSFSCVLAWRSLQEEKMISALKAKGQSTELAQTPKEIERFIAHYQRLTEHALTTMPTMANFLLRLNKDHQFISFEESNIAT